MQIFSSVKAGLRLQLRENWPCGNFSEGEERKITMSFLTKVVPILLFRKKFRDDVMAAKTRILD